jgi:putative addiction module component (TIGR02574 family)
MHSVEELTEEVLKLPTERRFELARKILLSVESESGVSSDGPWDAEIRDRIARYRTGQVKTISGADVLAELDRKLGR